MRKVVTFIGVVTTMAALGSLIFLVEKADTGEEWAAMALWFALCDWLLPNPRPGSLRETESPTTLPPRIGVASDARNREPRARAALAAQR